MPVPSPFSVRKKLGLVKSDEADPLLAVKAAESQEKTMEVTSGTVSDENEKKNISEIHASSPGAGIAADPVLLKEMNRRLQVIEALMKSEYKEESYTGDDVYEYGESGLKEYNRRSPFWLSAFFIIILTIGFYYIFSGLV